MKYKTHPPGWFLFLTKLFCYVSLVNSQAVVQSNTITYGNSPSGFDDGYIVLGGAYLAFQDMNSVPMYQTVRVDKGGSLYYLNNGLQGFDIESKHALFVSFVFRNDGTVVVDDRNSTSSGSWTINSGSFTNTGNMMFTSSHGDTFEIDASSVVNTGYIYSKGTSANMPQILKLGNYANPWYNTGTICLANTTFELGNPIQGIGCVTVGQNALFDISSIDVQQQTIYLSDPSSVLSVTNGQNTPIYGLGNGNGFLFPIFPIKKVDYNPLTGIVHFTTGWLDLQSFTIPVGKGYNESLFEIVESISIQGETYNHNNFVRYNGRPPQPAPSICQPCVELPLYTFEVPSSYETTNELGFPETISFFSTYNSDKLPLIGTTTIYTPPSIYTITKSDKTTTATEIVSRVTGIDVHGNPFTYYTTLTNSPEQFSTVTKTITTTDNGGHPKTITTTETNKISNNTATYPSPPASGSDYTTVVTKSNGSVETDIVSHITTTDSNGKPTTMVTTYPSPPASGSDYTTVVTKSNGSVETDIVSHITTTDSNGKPTTIVTTVPSPTGSVDTTVVTNSDGSSQTDIISHITTTDSNGKPTTMVTTYPSPPASGSDYTTVVTKSNGSVETDIVSHITTTDSNGKPTTIVTTVPSPTGSVDTTVVTNSDGSSQTDIISHITTTDSNGKPTTMVTTYPSPPASGSDYTTVVTKSNGSVETDIVSHITTTDSNGKPTTMVTTYPSPPASGSDYTTVVTKSNGNIVSHITTTDSNGKPTTIVTTVPSPTGSVDTTVVTNSDGSSETDIISHITTTDSDGKPTTMVTTYPSPPASGSDYTTVVTKSNGSVETDI
ncbi:Hyphally regulated cell wall protein 1, partial [Nakaseomyces glabratus]